MITMTAHTTLPSLPRPQSQRGLSLIELMISLTIGLVLLLGITSLIVQQSSSRDELEKSSRQIENGRYAMQILHDDIQHAGFYGQYYSLPTPPATAPDPCLVTPITGAASIETGMSLPVQGYDFSLTATAASPISCLNTANIKPGTDILVIRRADSKPIAAPFSSANLLPGLVYLQTTTSSHVLDQGSNLASFVLRNSTTSNSGVANAFRYLVHIYFVSPCNTMANGTTCAATDDNGNPIPTLKLLELGATGNAPSINLIPLVEGIENMQLDYGIDTNGDGYPDNNYTTVPATTTDWTNVMSIRVNLLARNNDPTSTYSDGKTYNMGLAGTIGPFNVSPPYTLSPACGGTASYPQLCNYKRHLYTELIRANNPSGRRAQQ